MNELRRLSMTKVRGNAVLHLSIDIVRSSSAMSSSKMYPSSFSYQKTGSANSNDIGEDLPDVASSDGLVGGEPGVSGPFSSHAVREL